MIIQYYPKNYKLKKMQNYSKIKKSGKTLNNQISQIKKEK